MNSFEPEFTYRRPHLAVQYCDALKGVSIVDARSGLFLAAPRRTGKSTFLRVDLVPALDNNYWETVYVDLWKNKAEDPARLIAKAIKNSLTKYAGIIAKLARNTGLEKVNVLGALSVNISALDLPVDVTLADALEALYIAAQKPIVLIVDEAQHAISSESGMDAIFALKAARDHLNQGGDEPQRLYLVFTGSNQDKLSRLVQKKTQPFFGCNITKFPLLGRGYSDGYTDYVNKKLSEGNQFAKDDVWEAFQLVGQRPEKLRSLIAKVALGQGAAALAEDINSGAKAIQDEIWAEMESEFTALTKTQRAVLVRIIDAGAKYEPFNEASLAAYTAYVGKKISTSDAQAALNVLREKNIVWKATHGDYALEDESMATWFNTQIRPTLSISQAPAVTASNRASSEKSGKDRKK